MSRVDAGYVAYLTRENAWLRARCTDLADRLAVANATLEELGLEVTVLEARLEERERMSATPDEVLPCPRAVDGT